MIDSTDEFNDILEDIELYITREVDEDMITPNQALPFYKAKDKLEELSEKVFRFKIEE